MRIAQIAPLFESVPPRKYGGTERVVAHLTDELVNLGHDVTLFATGDSRTSGTLVPFRERALRLDPTVRDPWAPHMHMLEHVFQRAPDFDVIHFHTDYWHFPLMRRMKTPWLTTLHGRQDMPEIWPLYAEFHDAPLVSITDAQRGLPEANWIGTVYHGLPVEQYPWREEPGDYLCFVGRMDQDKGADQAIATAKRTGLPLKLAGKIEPQMVPYFETEVQPHLEPGKIEYLGEVSETEKLRLMRNALVVLFPIRWPEPFGLVMIEAMAGGTPVVAYDWGSVPEVIDEGVTGCVVPDDPEAAAEAVERATKLDRRRVRARFEERFSSERMARDYVNLYERLIERGLVHKSRLTPLPRRTAVPPARPRRPASTRAPAAVSVSPVTAEPPVETVSHASDVALGKGQP